MARKPPPAWPRRNASAWSNSITQVGEPWMPIFRSTRDTRTRFRVPSGSVTGQSARLRPWVVPRDWSNVAPSRASTRCMSAPPFVMKILLPSMK